MAQEGDVADDVFGAGGGAGFSVDGEDGEGLRASGAPVDEARLESLLPDIVAELER